MPEQLLIPALVLAALALLAAWVALRLAALERRAREQAAQLAQALEEKHRYMLKDLHDGLTRQGDRLGEALSRSSGELRAVVEGRLDQIGGRVAERLDEGFRRTNETFTSVMARLAAIDEAQKKLDGLTSNVVTLQ